MGKEYVSSPDPEEMEWRREYESAWEGLFTSFNKCASRYNATPASFHAETQIDIPSGNRLNQLRPWRMRR